MPLNTVSHVCRGPPEVETPLFLFSVVSPDTTYQLATSSMKETDAWIEVIQTAVDAIRGKLVGPCRNVRIVLGAWLRVMLTPCMLNPRRSVRTYLLPTGTEAAA